MKTFLVTLILSVLFRISYSTPEGPRPVEVEDLELRYNYDKDIFELNPENRDAFLSDFHSPQDERPKQAGFLDLAGKPAELQEQPEKVEFPFGLRRPQWPSRHEPPHFGLPHHGLPHHRPSRPPHHRPTNPSHPSTLPDVSTTEEPIKTTSVTESDANPGESSDKPVEIQSTAAPAEPSIVQ